jgi:hypothetical protein
VIQVNNNKLQSSKLKDTLWKFQTYVSLLYYCRALKKFM